MFISRKTWVVYKNRMKELVTFQLVCNWQGWYRLWGKRQGHHLIQFEVMRMFWCEISYRNAAVERNLISYMYTLCTEQFYTTAQCNNATEERRRKRSYAAVGTCNRVRRGYLGLLYQRLCVYKYALCMVAHNSGSNARGTALDEPSIQSSPSLFNHLIRWRGIKTWLPWTKKEMEEGRPDRRI